MNYTKFHEFTKEIPHPLYGTATKYTIKMTFDVVIEPLHGVEWGENLKISVFQENSDVTEHIKKYHKKLYYLFQSECEDYMRNNLNIANLSDELEEIVL